MAFGDRLKEAREMAKLTRPQLAEKLGVTKSAISNYENGVSSPKEEVMLNIFTALHIEPNYLFQDSFVTATAKQYDEYEIMSKYNKLNNSGKDYIETQIDFALSQQKYLASQPHVSDRR